VTRQPAIQIGTLLLVALVTNTHPPDLAWEPVHVLDIPVTRFTGNVAVDMSLMVKKHMLGYIVDRHPGGGGVGVKIHMLLFNPGMVSDDVFMAVQTFFHRRQPRMVRVVDIGVAKAALNLFDTVVNRMAEWYRLLRSDPGGRRGIIEIEKSGDEKQTANGQQNGCNVLSQRSGYLL